MVPAYSYLHSTNKELGSFSLSTPQCIILMTFYQKKVQSCTKRNFMVN
uniref:Uncharacterized protein n=1 Tax=Arundo donax TaxID=35708 RepID=A0A0A9HBI0_ARUDO